MAWAGGEKARVRVRVRVTRVTQVTRVGVRVGSRAAEPAGVRAPPGTRAHKSEHKATIGNHDRKNQARKKMDRAAPPPPTWGRGRGREGGGRGPRESVGREVRGWGEGETGGGAATGLAEGARVNSSVRK